MTIKIPTITLNNGVEMPQEGFGVFQISDLATCKQAVKDALEVGYRSIDTAQAYYNEEAVGEAIKESSVAREDIFLTTKVWIDDYGYEKTKKSIEVSLQKLQTDYIDLVLLHQPFSDYYGAYHALEDLYEEKKIRAIGVSNWSATKLVDLAEFNRIAPAIDQLETNVFCQQQAIKPYLDQYKTQIEAWGPLAQGANNIFENSVLTEIGKNHGKTAAQVALRYLTQNGVVIIPKSTHKKRMQQNLDIWDFTLNDAELEQIQQLDTGHSLTLDHDAPETVKFFANYSKNNAPK